MKEKDKKHSKEKAEFFKLESGLVINLNHIVYFWEEYILLKNIDKDFEFSKRDYERLMKRLMKRLNCTKHLYCKQS